MNIGISWLSVVMKTGLFPPTSLAIPSLGREIPRANGKYPRI